MISARLKQFLDDNGAAYTVVQHDPAFTAQQLAARMHVPGRELVKVVVVKLDGRHALAAVPAPRLVDFKALARLAGVKKCSLASEDELQQLFPDCEVGAMAPFGNLYQLATFVDEEVSDIESMVVNAGTHADAVRLRYSELERLVHPRVGSFTVPPPVEVTARKRAEKARRKKAAKAKVKKKIKAKAKKKAKARKKAGARKKGIKKKPTKRKAKRKKAAKKARKKAQRKATRKSKRRS